MTWNQIKGDWQQLSVKLREKWSKFTDDELRAIAGNRDQVVCLLQQRYDHDKERAEVELDAFVRRLTS
jgi:uncharacterized protein YjbJ (UPF0337 family)